jgi:hypothetical protein
MHPLAPDASGFSDAELQQKIIELNKKRATAYRMGSSDLIHQIELMYNDYLEEQNKRERHKMEEAMKSSGRDFDDIIDVN